MGVFSFAELVLLSFFASNAAFLGLFQPRQQVIHLFIANRLHIIGVCLTALMRYNNIADRQRAYLSAVGAVFLIVQAVKAVQRLPAFHLPAVHQLIGCSIYMAFGVVIP